MAYDPNFIPDLAIPLPKLGKSAKQDAFNDGQPINHTRYSLVFNEARGFAIYTAHNIDGSTLPNSGYTNRSFKFDPDVKPNSLQVGNKQGYKGSHNDWDRGHMVRRLSMSWGNEDVASKAERESDYYTNIAPQHELLHSRSWGKIEDWMLERVREGTQRVSVFTGPVFSPDDPEIVNLPGQDPVRIPAGFWKILVVKPNDVMRAAGFLVWQRDYDSDQPLAFEPVLEQVRLTTIEFLSKLSFEALRGADPLLFGEQETRRREAVLRVFSGAPRSEAAESETPSGVEIKRANAVRSAEDIIL